MLAGLNDDGGPSPDPSPPLAPKLAPLKCGDVGEATVSFSSSSWTFEMPPEPPLSRELLAAPNGLPLLPNRPGNVCPDMLGGGVSFARVVVVGVERDARTTEAGPTRDSGRGASGEEGWCRVAKRL